MLLNRAVASSLLLLVSGLATLRADGPLDAKTYIDNCALCHQPNGIGVPPSYPPLDGSEWLTSKREEAIKALCEGLSGPIEVAGRRYDNVMPAQILDDAQVAEVLSYLATSWSNKA